MPLYTIYKAINKVNGKVYIGFDSKYPNRITVHKSASKNQDCKFYRAIRKYGWDNFEWEILYQSADRDYTLNIMETYFINEYDSLNNGYNSTLGGEGSFGMVLSESAKIKISIGNSIPKPHTTEHNKNISLALKKFYSNNPNFGKGRTHTEETKKRLSQNMSGKPKSKSHIENMKLRPQDTTKIMCEHCGKSGDYKNMKRWHGDRCKQNPDRTSDLDKNVTCKICGLLSKQTPNFYRYHNDNCSYVQSP